jgi:hypothetical protein
MALARALGRTNGGSERSNQHQTAVRNQED